MVGGGVRKGSMTIKSETEISKWTKSVRDIYVVCYTPEDTTRRKRIVVQKFQVGTL